MKANKCASGDEEWGTGWREALYGALMRASVGAFQSLDLQYYHVLPPDERSDEAPPTDTTPPMVCTSAPRSEVLEL